MLENRAAQQPAIDDDSSLLQESILEIDDINIDDVEIQSDDLRKETNRSMVQ